MPTEILVLVFAGVLLVAQLLLAAWSRALTFGFEWAAGPRDSRPGEVPLWGERSERAYRNLLETFPLFAAFALAVSVTGTANGISAAGAWLYLAARVAYVPAYVSGIPHVRSLIWVAAMVGIAMIGFPLLTAMTAAGGAAASGAPA